MSGDFRSWQILLQKSFWGEERKFLEPLMRFASGDLGDHIVPSKIDQDLPTGAEKRRSSRKIQRSTFARFLGLFDFRLLQEYGTKRTCWGRLTMSAPEGKTDVPREPGHFRF
jgi:hypothetical protein